MADTKRTGGGPSGPPWNGCDTDRKPVSDEAHSAFTPPSGIPVVPQPQHEGSAFTRPGPAPIPGQAPVPGQVQHPAAATPPGGVPAARLPAAPWQDRMRTLLRQPSAERATPEQHERAEIGPSIPRVLDLTLRIGELLLAGGEGAEDVETAMFGVAHAYGLARCEPTVTFTLLSISYHPSLVDSPVTASRVVRRRATDYTRLAAVYRLVDDIAAAELSLEEAYRRLAEIRRNRHPYPGWLLTASAGVLAGAASVLVGGDAAVFGAALVAAVLGDRFAWLLAGRGLPEFYQFVAAAMPAAAMGVVLQLAGVDLRAGGAAVITGGLFALIPGRPLVAAVHDGLTGFYITASARLLEVGYLIVGIVCGVLLVLYVGVRFGAELNPEGAAGAMVARPGVQLAAAMVLTLAFAVLLQTERQTLLLVTLNGGVAWTVYGVLHYQAELSAVLATLVAAGLVGLFGQLLSRYRYASVLPYVTAAIGPLLPGTATYLGLLAFAQGHLDTGWFALTRAVALALAIAVGVNLGGEIARLFMRVPGFEDPARRRAAKRTRGF